MYWFNPNSRFIAVAAGLIIFITALQGCKPAIKETGAKLTYFDIKGYFARESARLTKLNKPVLKTVAHNGVAETKRVHITNWAAELDMFNESDINKPAWKNSYTVQTDSGITIYQATNPGLKTREIMIKQVNNKVKWMVIYNATKNMFYHHIEKLSYFPDSLYLIEIKQTVRLLGTNKYQVKGFFNQ